MIICTMIDSSVRLAYALLSCGGMSHGPIVPLSASPSAPIVTVAESLSLSLAPRAQCLWLRLGAPQGFHPGLEPLRGLLALKTKRTERAVRHVRYSEIRRNLALPCMQFPFNSVLMSQASTTTPPLWEMTHEPVTVSRLCYKQAG